MGFIALKRTNYVVMPFGHRLADIVLRLRVFLGLPDRKTLVICGMMRSLLGMLLSVLPLIHTFGLKPDLEINKMNLTETLAALEAAETILRLLAPADESFNRELFTVSENTRLSLAAHDCQRIRVELMWYFNDPANHDAIILGE